MGDAQVDDLQCKALVLCGAVLEFLELSILTLTSSFASIRVYAVMLTVMKKNSREVFSQVPESSKLRRRELKYPSINSIQPWEIWEQ